MDYAERATLQQTTTDNHRPGAMDGLSGIHKITLRESYNNYMITIYKFKIYMHHYIILRMLCQLPPQSDGFFRFLRIIDKYRQFYTKKLLDVQNMKEKHRIAA